MRAVGGESGIDLGQAQLIGRDDRTHWGATMRQYRLVSNVTTSFTGTTRGQHARQWAVASTSTIVFGGYVALAHHAGTFTSLLFVLGMACAFGMASGFKLIAAEFPTDIDTISGIVVLAGGLGGFILPIMFGALFDLTSVRATAFTLMYGAVGMSLIWMYRTRVRRAEGMGGKTATAPRAA